MKIINHVCVLLVLLWCVVYGVDYLTLWWSPAPKIAVEQPHESPARITIADPISGDRVVWERDR